MTKKAIALVLSVVLIVGGVVMGTVAWLTAQTDTVENVFTIGDINLTLTEAAQTGWTGKMVPGNYITKDPVVTVKAGSEASYVFVKVDEANIASYIDYVIAEGWNPVDNAQHVYYREVEATSSDATFDVLLGNKVKVREDVTKSMMEALKAEGATQPSLSFTAYAVQKDNIATAAEAWAQVNPANNTATVD